MTRCSTMCRKSGSACVTRKGMPTFPASPSHRRFWKSGPNLRKSNACAFVSAWRESTPRPYSVQPRRPRAPPPCTPNRALPRARLPGEGERSRSCASHLSGRWSARVEQSGRGRDLALEDASSLIPRIRRCTSLCTPEAFEAPTTNTPRAAERSRCPRGCSVPSFRDARYYGAPRTCPSSSASNEGQSPTSPAFTAALRR